MTLFGQCRHIIRLLVGSLTILGDPLAAAFAESDMPDAHAVADFYSGRRMIMISGHTPEGGDRQQERAFAGMTITSGLKARGEDDLHGRLLARHMGRHIPGEPQFVVQIMPGAGGRRAARYLYAEAPKDGSVIGNLERGLAVEPLLVPEPMNGALTLGRFDPARFQWLGSLYGDVGFVIAWNAAGEISTRDLFEQGLLVGGTIPLDDSVVLTRALNALLGTRFKLVSGYTSTIELQIAMERGEIAGFLSGSSDIKSRLVPWTETGQAHALLQLGLHRDPAFPDVPLALEFARTEADRQALEFIFARQSFGSPYAAPPDVPADRVAALRRAFEATMADSDFRADARRLEISVKPLSGDALNEMIARLLAAPGELRARAASAMSGRAGNGTSR